METSFREDESRVGKTGTSIGRQVHSDVRSFLCSFTNPIDFTILSVGRRVFITRGPMYEAPTEMEPNGWK
jgi:hypothetical protein